MDTDTTTTPETADAPAQEPATATTPDGPWGTNPRTGKPYRRDPALFAHLKGKPRGTASKRTRTRRAPTPSGPTSPAPSTRPAPARGKPAYGKRVAELGQLGLLLVADPVDREILVMQLAELAPLVDQLCAESPSVAAFLDRYLMKIVGGAKVDIAMWAAVTGGLIAMNHGVAHPMLTVFLGAGLEKARANAATTAKAAEAFRTPMPDADDHHRAWPKDAPPPAPEPVPVILGY